jgi:SAM-dependent MidA family methyltransferase
MPIHFPPLTPEMQAHSEAVKAHIQMEIQKAGGYISFARFMELSLYAPGLGYYSSGSHKLGKAGDFVTAPEISPLFGKCVAQQFAEILETIPSSDILEIGAGAGTFAQDVLQELAALKTLPAHYYILETSADLRQRQQALLKNTCPQFFSRIIWLDRLPEAFHGIIFANEVLDALPFHCFEVENNQIKERCVTFNEDYHEFAWISKPPLTTELNDHAQTLRQQYALPNGYHSEINLLLPSWIKTLAAILQQGVMIFFDYGYGQREYYHSEKTSGTLRCYFQHRCHNNPFMLYGLQDITAHVDFTSVIESALDSHLELAGYTSQSAFLLATGIAQFAEAPPFSMQHYQQSQAMKLLMLPSEMGALVKTIAFSKHWEKPLKGYSLFDKRHEL